MAGMIPFSFPILPFSVYIGNILFLLAWFIFSFLFWRGLRRWGVEEDRIFDLTFYATLAACMMARAGFVLTNWHLFAGKSPLLIAALWVTPGLSWLAGLVGGIAALVSLSRGYKVRLGHVLDAASFAFPLSIIVGEAASFVDGLEVGKAAPVPWAIVYGSHPGTRHPVQLYEMIAVFFIALLMIRITAECMKKKVPYGIAGVWFFVLYSVTMFVLELFKESRVYWGSLTANQWVLIGIFAECMGVLYVRGGGRQAMRPVWHMIQSFIQKKGKQIYAAVSRKHTDRN